MRWFLILLVGSVFLGTEFLNIETPFLSITLYRLLALSVPIILIYQLAIDQKIKINIKSYSFSFLCAIFIWWFWALVSAIWVQSTIMWLQAVFLLTLGFLVILALYLWVNRIDLWITLMKAAWLMMTGLAILGFYEMITNHYIFADLTKLDKYNTFVSEPLTRIPITHFANQNDYAIMLLGYLTVALVLYQLSAHASKKIIYALSVIAAIYLIYRTDSRLAFLCLILFIVILGWLRYHLSIYNFARKYKYNLIFGSFLVVSFILATPFVRETLLDIAKPLYDDYLTGDEARINMLLNGLIYFGHSLGLGVGAGNIEYYMGKYAIHPTNEIVNIHNWWGDILVGYGIVVFSLYLVSYLLIIWRFYQIQKTQSAPYKNVTKIIIAFLITYILGSMLSASNMKIEWHWVMFALINSYLNIIENQYQSKMKSIKMGRIVHEFKYNH